MSSDASDGSDEAEFFDAAERSRSRNETLACTPFHADQQRQQQQQLTTTALSRASSTSRGRAADTGLSQRRSSPLAATVDIPPTPAIPARFLNLGRGASIASQARHPLRVDDGERNRNLPPALGSDGQVVVSNNARPDSRKRRHTSALPLDRASIRNAITTATTSSFSSFSSTPSQHKPKPSLKPVLVEKQRAESLPTTPIIQLELAQVDVDVRTLSKLESRAPSQHTAKMSRTTRSRNGDLFLDVAGDNDYFDDNENMGSDDELVQRLRSSSRASYSGKRRSLPADLLVNNANDRRPSTSGHLCSRPSSRLHTTRPASDFQRHMDQYKSPTNRATFAFGDNISVSGQSNSGRSRRYSAMPDHSPASPSRLRDRLQSPELPSYGRRRPSFGTTITPSRNMESFEEEEEESPTQNVPQQQADSNSNESQPVETVWDEIDDLKSRIKSLEFNGPAPTSSSAAASGDSSDRPRTATTAPTTIDSSPKNARKPQSESKKATPTPPDSASATKTIADSHPPLHVALEKARPLLNAVLMRTLNATASDALQLAAITSTAGPQGTNYSAASIINGLTVSDRHVRRKVDNMCRNLTELCLALCEGKHEAPTILTSPAPMIESPIQDSPLVRYSSVIMPERSSSIGRPMSRLDVRKSSILGGSLAASESISPRGSVGDISSGEQEQVPNSIHLQQPRRVSRAPSSVFSSRQRQDDVSGDEDVTTFRPPSRAMTDIGAYRSKSRITNENKSPAAQRTPSLRESLTKKSNEAAYERNLETPRMASIGSGGRRRRLFDHESTPPVLEEEADPSENHTPSQPRRRITSLGHYSTENYSSRKSELPGRTTSLSQRRQVIAE